MITGTPTIVDCGQSKDKTGRTFWCEYVIRDFSFRFEFYTEYREIKVQQAGQAALDRFMTRAGFDVDDISGLRGRTFNIELAKQIDDNKDIRPETWRQKQSLARRLKDGGYVYVVSCSDSETSLCKIGIANDVEKRFLSLRTTSPHTLKLDAAYPSSNARETESMAHWHFADSRRHGEWFAIAPELAVAFVSEAVSQNHHR